MHNNRQRPRRNTPHLVRALDANSGTVLGRVVDITADGMMLVTDQTLEVGRIYEMRINLPVVVHYRTDVEVEAEIMWTKPDTNPHYFRAGLRFVNLPGQDGFLLEDVMHRLNLVG